jgi:NADPH2:quinone reductase
MRAIVFHEYGGPERLEIEERPAPEPRPRTVVIAVRAFGLNRAETYMRSGKWGEVARVSGIECVGEVVADPSGRLARGQKAAALMGGMGRTIDGSYAELTRVPASNVVPLATTLPWSELAAIPESYATAWTCLHRNLALARGEVLLIRGATSALGQAALNIAAAHGAVVIATTRRAERIAELERLGAKSVLLDAPDLSRALRERYPDGIDAVLDLVGNRTILDSLRALRRDGRACLAGFLGGGEPMAAFNPIADMASGVHFSFFGSFVFGTPGFPLDDVPLQEIVERVQSGAYQAKPARVFRFDEIREAHCLIEANEANGKLVVEIADAG